MSLIKWFAIHKNWACLYWLIAKKPKNGFFWKSQIFISKMHKHKLPKQQSNSGGHLVLIHVLVKSADFMLKKPSDQFLLFWTRDHKEKSAPKHEFFFDPENFKKLYIFIKQCCRNILHLILRNFELYKTYNWPSYRVTYH